jgi:hypothetical protein
MWPGYAKGSLDYFKQALCESVVEYEVVKLQKLNV